MFCWFLPYSNVNCHMYAYIPSLFSLLPHLHAIPLGFHRKTPYWTSVHFHNSVSMDFIKDLGINPK